MRRAPHSWPPPHRRAQHPNPGRTQPVHRWLCRSQSGAARARASRGTAGAARSLGDGRARERFGSPMPRCRFAASAAASYQSTCRRARPGRSGRVRRWPRCRRRNRSRPTPRRLADRRAPPAWRRCQPVRRPPNRPKYRPAHPNPAATAPLRATRPPANTSRCRRAGRARSAAWPVRVRTRGASSTAARRRPTGSPGGRGLRPATARTYSLRCRPGHRSERSPLRRRADPPWPWCGLRKCASPLHAEQPVAVRDSAFHRAVEWSRSMSRRTNW